MNYKLPKGTCDYYNESADKLNFIKNITENIFIKYGGKYLETPVFELKNIIMGKYGDEAENKLVYEIEDNGGEKLVLRYDLTIPFIRHLKENGIKKIKRYSIGKVYRRDNPNLKQGRFREFYQADFDIVGEDNSTMIAECTIFKMICEILDKLNIKNYKILINDTENLKEVLINILKIPESNFKNVCSSIDKLDKVSFKDIRKELGDKGLSDDQINNLELIIKSNDTYSKITESKLDKISNIADVWNIRNKLEYKLSLARGLDYYNGIIFEVKIYDFPSSICAGGRYDNLVDNNTFIGFSLGITRIMDLVNLNNTNKWKKVYNFTTLGNISYYDKIKMIEYVRNNISKDNQLNYSFEKEDKKLGKYITQCVQKFEKYLVIISEEEYKDNQIILKDLENNTQEVIKID